MSQEKMFQTHGKKQLFPALFALLAFIPLNTQAGGLVLTGEIAVGGDKLASVSGDYEEDLRAGQLLNLGMVTTLISIRRKPCCCARASTTSSTASTPTMARPISTAGRWT